MVAISVEGKVINILNSFVESRIEDALLEISEFREDEFVFSIKFSKYHSCVNAHVANTIVEFQKAIYRIAALHVKGKLDIRLLSEEEKKLLEVPFKITKGSTVSESVRLLNTAKELLKMMPEEQRGYVLVAVLIIIYGSMSWGRYLEHKERMGELHVVESAMEIIKEKDSKQAKIISTHEKALLSTLSKVDDEVEFQKNSYTKEELKTIIKNKYPRNVPKQITSIKGVFRINDINIKNSYLIVEKSPTPEPGDIKIYYDSDDLHAQMIGIKASLKSAIDNETKLFYIEASVINKNGKIDTRALTKIEESRTLE